MIEKKTVIDQIEVTRNGTIQLRIGLLLLEDGTEIDCKWHRTSIEPGGSVDDQIAAVNASLQQMGKLPLVDGVDLIRGIVAAAQTPDVVSAFQKAVAMKSVIA